MIFRLHKANKQLSGQIHLSASKSESNRVLIMNALSGGLLLSNLSDARDTVTMQRLLSSGDAVWDVLDAGTTMRFCTAYLGIEGDDVVITGSPRMKERPIGLLVDALKRIGADISYEGIEGYPPLRISKIEEQSADHISIPGNVSSQYISALLMSAPRLPKGLSIELTGEIYSLPYIEMTLGLMEHFGISHEMNGSIITIQPQHYQSASYKVESDWSGASYWYSLAALSEEVDLTLIGLRENSFQGDQEIHKIMSAMGVESNFGSDGVRLRKMAWLEDELSIDFRHCPDLAQTVMVAAAIKGLRLEMTGLESLKIKETNRVAAMMTELSKLGASLKEDTGRWTLTPGEVPAQIKVISTYEDHRMAMAFAPVCTVRDVHIDNPSVVEKSYPGFWDHFASVGTKIQELNA